MNKKSITDLDVYGKKVIVRVDYNVPLQDKEVDGNIVKVVKDDTRIVESLPTIKYLLSKGASLVLVSHLGRPDGKADKKYSMQPVYDRLCQLLEDVTIYKANDVVGKDAIKKANDLQMGQVLLLENVRYEKGEELNDKDFALKLSKLAEIYVNDAFGTAHRKHASTYGIALILPSAVGFLIEKELTIIGKAINQPKRPLVGVLGGAKVSDKIKLVDSLINVCDKIIIGGAMAYTFLKAKGVQVGNSLVDNELIDMCKQSLEAADKKGVTILLPVDHIVASKIDDNQGEYNKYNINDNFMGVDIGKNTVKLFKKAIKKAKTVIWNGPMGVFENKAFSLGTYQIAKAVSKTRATTIIGGGDSASAVVSMGFKNKVTHISTGGGASLKLFEGKVLAGVDAIENK